MATCSVTDLASQACTNGFLKVAQSDPQMARAVSLQLLKNIGGDTNSIATLMTQACANGFLQLVQSGAQLVRSIHVQLLCNIAGGVAALCVNLVPPSAVYLDGVYSLQADGINLTVGSRYQITFGALTQDFFAANFGQANINNPGAGVATSFTATDANLVLVGRDAIPTPAVTVSVCLQ